MNKISAYTFFTDSHRELLDYFLSTFKYEAGLDLTVRYLEQITINGTSHEYGSENFISTCRQKLIYINDIISSASDGEIFIFLDCDMVFLHPIKNIFLQGLGDSDMAFQSDGTQLCMGCFVCRVSEKTRSLFKDATPDKYSNLDDQGCINNMLKESKYSDISTNILSNRICNYDKIASGLYTPAQDNTFPVGKLKEINPVLFHTNWTVGVPNKIHMTKLVLQTLTGEMK